MIQKLLRAFFPRRCPICDKVVKKDHVDICEECREKITAITEPICKKCGKPIAELEEELCYDCRQRNTYFNRGYAVWTYNQYMKNSIALFKYGGRKEYGDFYVREMLYYLQSQIRQIEPELVVPIPLHRSRMRYRGFNQAEVLAHGIAKGLQYETCDLLYRKKKTLPQKGLNDKDRRQNLKHAFAIKESMRERLQNVKCVLLVDDIYTTGSTIDECARVLNKAGVQEVYFVCLCIGKDF